MIKKLIHRPIAVTMTTIAIIVLGFVAAGLLPIGLMPAVDIPEITVRINAPNTSARELNTSVITPLRQQLMQTSRLRDIRSEVKDGGGTIYMQFEYGADIDYLFIDVNERVDRSMGQMPKDVERPTVVKASATDIPAFYLNLSLKEEGNILDLSTFAQTVITKRLEQLPQVAFVDISGQLYPELVIIADQQKIEGLGVTGAMLENAIRSNNINMGNLTVRDGQYQFNVRFSSTITTKSDIENVKLNLNGRLYKISELAQVKHQPQKQNGMVIADGANAITMAVIKQSDARMDALQSEISKLIGYFETDYPDLKFTMTRDQTELLQYSIGNLEQNLVIGALLAALVLFLFMQDLRTPLLITITIPLSLIVSLLFFYAVGISINIISLSGLLLGLGMMVDNSIIVIDNISQRWDRGDSLSEAVAKGTEEVFGAMLSSVLTTCSIFVPLIFLSGIAGAMFYDQAMAVSIGLISSLIVAMTIIPVYYHLFYRHSSERKTNKFLEKLQVVDYEQIYESGLRWTFRHQGFMWGSIAAMIIGTVFLYNALDKSTLPAMAKSDAMLCVNWNNQISAIENRKRTTDLVAHLEGIDQYTSMVGQQRFMLSHTKELSKNESLIYVKSENIEDVIKQAQQYMQKTHPEATFMIDDANNIFDMIFADTEPMLLARLRPTSGRAPEPDKLNPLLGQLAAKLPNIYIDPVQWQEHITLYTNPDLLALYKVDHGQLYYALKSAFNENKIFDINEGQFSIPVKIGESEQTVRQVIDSKTVLNADQIEIPLRVLLTESQDRDLKNIVSGSEGDFYPLATDISADSVMNTMQTIKNVVSADNNFEVSFTGSYFSNQATTNQLIIVLLVSLALLYFILASQFESLVQPLIIMSEIVVDIFGALLVLWICGATINIMSMIGIVIMCGIVINDSILKVDTINKLRRSGYSTLRAVLMGGRRRLKPIIMTSLTTILAIVPFLFSGGMGNDLQRPLSLALIGGMVVGTLVSVFFIPLFYYYIYKKR